MGRVFVAEFWGLTIWDWAAVVAYLAGMVLIGAHFSRRQRSTSHYFTAGGRIPGWAAGFSLFATLLSSFVFIAFPGQTYQYDWQVLMQQFSTPLIILGVAVFIIPVFRRVIRISAYEYLEQRFGYAARVYGTVGFLADHFFKMAVVIATMSLAISGITQIEQDLIIIVLGVITIAYTFVGGIEGVIWTDVAQGLLMLACSVIALLFIVFLASPDGPGAVVGASITSEKMRLIDPEFTMTGKTVWVITWSGVFHFMIRYIADQTMVQRYLTAPTLREARKGAFVSIGACMVAWVTFSLIGTMLHGFYTLHPERLDASVNQGDKVFPYFIGQELPPGLVGLVMVGLLAASMSTIASELNSFGACIVSDFYTRMRPDAPDRRRLWLSRAVVLVMGVLGVALAVWMSRYKEGIMLLMLTIFNWMGATFGGGMLAMFVLGMFSRRAHWRGVYPALVIGLLFAFWCAGTSKGWFTPPAALAFLSYRWHEWWLIGLSTVIIFVLAYGLSLLFGGGERAALELTAYCRNTPSTEAVPLPHARSGEGS